MWLKCNQYYLMKANDFESIKCNANVRKYEEGLFITFSRFKSANLPFHIKALIVLYTTHELANLVVFYFHLKVCIMVLNKLLLKLGPAIGYLAVDHSLRNC